MRPDRRAALSTTFPSYHGILALLPCCRRYTLLQPFPTSHIHGCDRVDHLRSPACLVDPPHESLGGLYGLCKSHSRRVHESPTACTKVTCCPSASELRCRCDRPWRSRSVVPLHAVFTLTWIRLLIFPPRLSESDNTN